MIKFLRRLDIPETYLNIIDAIYNITLNREELKAFSLKNKTRVSSFSIPIQFNT